MSAACALTHPLLSGVVHGFGVRGSTGPDGLLRPRQVHGNRVVHAGVREWQTTPEADAVLSAPGGPAVGVVTADCVPVLIAAGGWVGAVHAGWRGLGSGVIARAVQELREHAAGARTRAVIGPHIGVCCYEIDEPVVEGLAGRFAPDLSEALAPSRPGHHRLDLGLLAHRELVRAGLAEAEVAALRDACTFCDAAHYHSYRRDGPRAGRLLHFVAPERRPESS